MKRFLFFFFALSGLTAKSQSNTDNRNFSISGRINGIDTGTLYLGYYEKDNSYKSYSSRLDKGFFNFEGTLQEPSVGSFYLKTANDRYTDSDFVQLALEPRSMIFIASYKDFGNSRLIGSESQKLLAELNSKTKEDIALRNYYEDYSRSLRKKQTEDSSFGSIIGKTSDSLLALSIKAGAMHAFHQLQFVKDHPDSYLAAHFLENNQRLMPADTFKLYYNQLTQATRESLSGLRVKKIIDRADSVYNSTASADFTRKELKGSLLNFTSFRKGHYVLIDFWASWCIPCREESPHLIELFKKYRKSNFEIIGVASDNKYISAWKNAIKKDGNSIWKHVLEKPIGSVQTESAGDITGLYDVGALPTQVLIDDKGKIVGRYGNKGKPFSELDRKLVLVFGY